MNLKEAFHYQNYLEGLATQATQYLDFTPNVIRVTNEHLRSKANPDAADETVDGTAERPYSVDNNTIVDFLLAVLDERLRVATAIGKSKAAYHMDVDAEASANKYRHMVSKTLSDMASIKPSEKTVPGTDYKFNATGEQVRYTYDVKSVRMIDFDRNKVKSLAKALAAKADEVSIRIDRAMLDVQVEILPLFDVTDSFEDALNSYMTIDNLTI